MGRKLWWLLIVMLHSAPTGCMQLVSFPAIWIAASRRGSDTFPLSFLFTKRLLRGQPFNFWGGVWVILKKNILQVHVRKKKFPAQDYCPKKIHARTVGWKKILARCFLGWHIELYQQTVKRFYHLDLGKRDSLHNDDFPLDGLFFTFIAPVVTSLDTCFLNFKITAGVVIWRTMYSVHS